jgi:sialate O-acetylesterase
VRLQVGLAALLVSVPLFADPSLPALFSDHMVLQSGVPVPVWGWADPGERITVTIGVESRTAAANPQGRWEVRLSPLTAGSPLTMTVRGNKTLTVQDILVGEVWVCSGQSNMQFGMRATTTAKEDIAAANHPEIRLFTVPRESALEPLKDFRSAWKVCTPESVAEFTAVGYHFGRNLHERLNVPVGLIQSSWPGTQAEEWTAQKALDADPDFTPILDRWNQAGPEIHELYRRPVDFDLTFDDFEFVPFEGGSGTQPLDDFDGGAANRFGGEWTNRSRPEDEFTMDRVRPGYGGNGAALRFSGEQRVPDSVQIQSAFGAAGEARDMSRFSGLRFFVRGKGFFRIHVLQQSIRDSDNYTSAILGAPGDWTSVTVRFSELKRGGWGRPASFAPEELTGILIEAIPAAITPPRPPSGLFNAMIAPLAPFAIRGAAWYQGEGNAGRAYQYRKLLPAMIRSWRETWGQDDFPFLIVQLPNFRQRKAEPGEGNWAELREAQLLTHKTVPNTGLVVTIELGEADDVHPRDKREVGRRLALSALGGVYRQERVYSGPIHDSMNVEGNRVRVRFRHTGGGLIVKDGGPLKGFAVAGEDRKFVWAQAKIEGHSVVVWSDAVPRPAAVRYAWADNPECNLYNREGLPASPFRTDDWPGLTREAW